ncbi:MAG: DUF1634 domain-containing protein [Acidobacteriota bacterium]|nr:DUF1634 domain-containing protein [Acidobacteriota bacterium]
MNPVSHDRDDQLERLIGVVLKTGVTVSAFCLAAGLILRQVPATRGLSVAVIHVGLIVLLSTPVLRVVVSVYEYAREHDWLFVLLTMIVLVTLLGSLLVGIFG